MKIFRVENADGVGMFRGIHNGSDASIFVRKWIRSIGNSYTGDQRKRFEDCGDLPTHPMPADDGFGLGVSKYYQFACDSLDMLLHWVFDDEFIDYLRAVGFFIAVYECDEPHMIESNSGTQVAYHCHHAKRVNTLPLTLETFL